MYSWLVCDESNMRNKNAEGYQRVCLTFDACSDLVDLRCDKAQECNVSRVIDPAF